MTSVNRRDFVKFLGGTLALVPLSSCSSLLKTNSISVKEFKDLFPNKADDLVLAPGLKYEMLASWGDKINDKETFGFNNDYTAYFPIDENRGVLWVNHEYPDPKFVSGYEVGMARTKAQMKKEMESVGGSLIEIQKDTSGKWSLVKNSKYNRRLDGFTEIPIIAPRKIEGSQTAVGTFANCAGGITPWGTVLTCEENYHDFYGEKLHDGKEKKGRFGWDAYKKRSPHHYGWVVEVNPFTGEAKKLTSIGRYAHECCTVTKAKDGTIVAFSGDDKKDEFIYKFVSSKKNSLEEGELFVGDFVNGKWLSLDINKSEVLKKNFKDQTDILIHCRKAGRLLGATKMDRPEDFEIHPKTGDVYLTLTNNYSNKRPDSLNNYHGKILKISHPNGDYLSESFESSDFVVGGVETKMSCPDNLIFDKNGNLWMTNDISGSMMNKGPYKSFKNNGLFYIPTSGPQAGEVFQIASAPIDAELTGLTFTPDEKTLFLSVQHPGEKSPSAKKLSSHWPTKDNGTPRPSVVQISGRLLDELVGNAQG